VNKAHDKDAIVRKLVEEAIVLDDYLTKLNIIKLRHNPSALRKALQRFLLRLGQLESTLVPHVGSRG